MLTSNARLFVVVVFLSLQSVTVFGQQKRIDSLTSVLETVVDPIQKIEVLNGLSSAYFDYDARKGFEYASQAYDLSRDQKYSGGIRRSLTLKGFYFFITGDFPKALSLYAESSSIPIPKDELFGYNLVMTGNVYATMAAYDSAEIYYAEAIALLTELNALPELAFAYKNLARLLVLQWKNDQAGNYFAKALEIYEARGNKYGMADTWFSLSEVNKNKADFSRAAEYIQRACRIADEIDEEFLQARCLTSNGNIRYRLGEYPDALKIYFQALGIMKSKNIPSLLADLYGDIGDVYRGLGENEVAWKYYVEALKISEKIGLKHERAKLYANIAWLYKNQNSFAMAHDYLEKSLALRTQIKDDHGISHCYNVLGIIYYQEKKYAKAIESLNRSLAIRKKIKHMEGVSSCLYNLSLVFAAQNQFQKSLQHQVDALSIEESIGNKFNIGFSYNRLGNLYTKLKKFPQAETHLRRAEKISLETNSNTLQMNNHLFWSEFYEAKRNPALALLHYKKYSAAQDSIYGDIGAQKLAELQALYLMEKKDEEIGLLNQEKLISKNEIELQRSKISLQHIIILSAIAGLFLVSLLAFVTYRYNRRIKKAHREISDQKEEIQSQSEELMGANETIAEINKKLEGKIEERTLALSQAYKELDTFFYRSSHDFRRPLTTFMGLAEVAKVTVKDANALELFEKVKETASNLDKMLIKLQSISDLGTQQLVYKEVMIKGIFNTVCDNFRDELRNKNIKTSAEINLHEPFISYPAMVKIIIENLVENAIHFCGVEKPFIRLKTSQSGNYITIDVQDNGQGIPKEFQDQIFDMYFRANERSKGNGLGLYIVKKAVEKLEGSISLSSIPLVGTTFTIMLPREIGERLGH